MKNTRNKKRYVKYIAIALALVFFITAALLVVEIWEKRQGKFPAFSTEEGVITFQGDEYVRKENIDTFLVLGLDKYGSSSSADSHEHGVQTDFLMLLVFDNNSKKTTGIHINRDTMTKINDLGIGGVVVDSFTAQIALAYNYADDNDKVKCGNTKDAVEDLLCGIKVNHYLSLTMDAVPTLNDLVGGIEVTVLDDFTGIDDSLIKGEKVTLMGEQALRYVRTRQGLEDSSNHKRMARQQQYIRALYDKTISCINSDDAFLVKLMDEIDDYIVYDSSNERMHETLNKYKDYEFVGTKEIDGETKMGEEFLEFYPDEDSIWQTVVDLFYEKNEN